MGKKKSSEFPEQIVIRLSTAQRTWLDNAANLHGLKGSDIVRGLIDSARADQAINKIEEVLGAVN